MIRCINTSQYCPISIVWLFFVWSLWWIYVPTSYRTSINYPGYSLYDNCTCLEVFVSCPIIIKHIVLWMCNTIPLIYFFNASFCEPDVYTIVLLVWGSLRLAAINYLFHDMVMHLLVRLVVGLKFYIAMICLLLRCCKYTSDY